MRIQQKIDQISGCASEIDHIEANIALLEAMARTLIETDFQHIEVIMETMPTNGARPNFKPLYPVRLTFPGYTPPPEEVMSQPIGYQHWYNSDELTGKEGAILIQLILNSGIALAVIDTALNRLKKRRQEIIQYSKEIMKRPG